MPMSVDLGETLEGVVADLVAGGRYNSKSEVLREGIRLVQEREAALAELEAALKRGTADLDAGRGKSLGQVTDRLIAKYRAQATTRKT